MRHGDLVFIRGERWRVATCAAHGDTTVLDAVGCGAENGGSHARFLLPFEIVAPVPDNRTLRVVRPARWRRVARHELAAACPSWWSLRTATTARLSVIPYQLEPALAMLRGDACRFLIADAVGLGKTIQAGLMIAETLHRRPDARVLVVSPAGLRSQWAGELRDRFGLAAEVLDAAALGRLGALLPAGVNPWALLSPIVTSIDYVKRPEHLRALEALTWDLVVFDEAHTLAGRSDRGGAAGMLARRARVVVALTATPHSGDEQVFSRLCRLGAASADPMVMFRRTRLDAGTAGMCRAVYLRVRLTGDEAAMHRALMLYARLVWRAASARGSPGARLAMCVLARRACSSAGSLARSVERRLTLLGHEPPSPGRQDALPFGDEEPDAVLASPGLQDGADERRRLAELLRCARKASRCESKIAALARLLRRTREPAIVFTEYRDTLQRLAGELHAGPMVQLHGGLTARERGDVLHRFTAGDARLLIATDAASEGLNLHQRCRIVVNVELPWTPTRLEQRAGRVDRIGQTRRVHTLHLVAAGSCEESTLECLAQRYQRLRDSIGGAAPVPSELRVGQSVLGRASFPELDAQAIAHPSGVVRLDLRQAARMEAARVACARRLSASAGTPDTRGGLRPIGTRIRGRRRARRPAQAVWAFRIAFSAASGSHLWAAVLPLTAALTFRPQPASAAWTRALLDPTHPAVQRALEEARVRLRDDLEGMLQAGVRVWIGRERAIVAELRAGHARLAATAIQPGLFGRGPAAAAAAQRTILEDAVSLCRSRLEDLASLREVRADISDLAFAVMLD